MRRSQLFRAAPLFVASVLLAAVCAAEDEPKIIKPSEGKDHLGEKVTVELTVAASKEANGVCFLNSEQDLKSDDNFTIFIGGKGLQKLKGDAKIDNPADYYLHKKIRVTGVVKTYRKKPEIVVESTDQIVVVEEDEKPKT